MLAQVKERCDLNIKGRRFKENTEVKLCYKNGTELMSDDWEISIGISIVTRYRIGIEFKECSYLMKEKKMQATWKI